MHILPTEIRFGARECSGVLDTLPPANSNQRTTSLRLESIRRDGLDRRKRLDREYMNTYMLEHVQIAVKREIYTCLFMWAMFQGPYRLVKVRTQFLGGRRIMVTTYGV